MPYVLMAVPAELVDQVGKLIEAAASKNGRPKSVDASSEFVNGWTEVLLREHYRSSSENMQAFLVCLAQNAGAEVSSEDAAEEARVEGLELDRRHARCGTSASLEPLRSRGAALEPAMDSKRRTRTVQDARRRGANHHR